MFIIYVIIGSLFFSNFYQNSFNLYINGNGGFVGSYLNQIFIKPYISIYEILYIIFFYF